MPYSDFTIERVQQDFNIEVIEDHDLFFHVKEVEVSSILMEALEFKVPLALAINTEKARSEFIISDILIDKKEYHISFLGKVLGILVQMAIDNT